jgi:hypothetical protein
VIHSAERRRLEAAYTSHVTAGAVLRRCAAGLLAVFAISLAGSVGVGQDEHVLAGVSAQPGATGH